MKSVSFPAAILLLVMMTRLAAEMTTGPAPELRIPYLRAPSKIWLWQWLGRVGSR